MVELKALVPPVAEPLVVEAGDGEDAMMAPGFWLAGVLPVIEVVSELPPAAVVGVGPRGMPATSLSPSVPGVGPTRCCVGVGVGVSWAAARATASASVTTTIERFMTGD